MTQLHEALGSLKLSCPCKVVPRWGKGIYIYIYTYIIYNPYLLVIGGGLYLGGGMTLATCPSPVKEKSWKGTQVTAANTCRSWGNESSFLHGDLCSTTWSLL